MSRIAFNAADDLPTMRSGLNSNFVELYGKVAGLRDLVIVPYAATITPNADTTSQCVVAAIAGALTVANPSGTPYDGQHMLLSLAATVADRAVTLGNQFQVPTSMTLVVPFTIVAGTETLIKIRWKTSTSKWQIVSYIPGY